MALVAGAHLGPYRIVAPLGAGGMGEVYRAHDPRLARDVALKLLPPAFAASPERLARFEREARTVAGLNHPNIVVLHSIEQDGDAHFISMELVEGRGLDTRVVPGGLPPGELVELALPLADALAAAHDRGVVHRDLKPANVMVTREGRVKVLDFGLARTAAAESDVERTQAATMTAPISGIGEIVGTVPYMAPEQIRGDAVDARSDVFSLGVVLYELATGRRPFAGRTFADVSSAILRDDPPPLASVRPDLGEALGGIVDRCLAKDPGARGTALDVLHALRAVKDGAAFVAPAARADGVASIAVLPFANRSASAEDEYFSDGLADELITVLSRIRGFRVAARTSAFTFKGRNATVGEIGRALNVASVLEGSVRKSGAHVRIAVQLVKVADGYPLWSESYDRTLDDIFAVQDDIARSVVKELRRALLGEEAVTDASGAVRAEVSRAARGRGADPVAHRLYLQARHLLDRSTQHDTVHAIDYLKQAIERDPQFALAWSELSAAYVKQVDFDWAPVADGTARAREAAARAVALQPDLAEGHAALAWIAMNYDWNWAAAEASMRRALALAPGHALVLRRAGVLAAFQGRHDEAIALYRRALEQDPLSASTYNNLGIALDAAGRRAEAEAAFRQALELAPQRAGTRSVLAMALLAQGRGEAALEEAAREPHAAFRLEAEASIHEACGRRAEADRALQELIASHAEGSAYQIAEVYAARGDADAAFAWLERAFAQRDGGVPDAYASPRMRALHGDPRWKPFLRRIGFTA